MPLVDRDHRQLVEGLNDLEKALLTGAGSRHLPQLLDFLERYATEHFAREEGCMRKYNCPTAAANEAAHREFIEKFGVAREKLKNSAGAGALVANQVHRELCDWIVKHILCVDSALRRCTISKRPVVG